MHGVVAAKHEAGIARDDVERLAELAGEEVGDLGRLFDEVEVSAALGREARHQLLVEVGAEAEGGRGDAAGTEIGRVTRERVRVLLAVVGEAVGEEQHTRHRGRVSWLRCADLGRALEPAAAKVGGAARVRRAQARKGERLGFRGRLCRGEERVDLVVVAHEGEAVAVVEEPDGVFDGLLCHVDLAAGHRAGAVEHERDMRDRAIGAPLARRRGDGDGEIPHGSGAGRDERAIGLDVHWGGLQSSGSHEGMTGLVRRSLRRPLWMSKGPHVEALDPQERPVPDDPCLAALSDEPRGRHAFIVVQRRQDLGVARAFGRHIGRVLESRSPHQELVALPCLWMHRLVRTSHRHVEELAQFRERGPSRVACPFPGNSGQIFAQRRPSRKSEVPQVPRHDDT